MESTRKARRPSHTAAQAAMLCAIFIAALIAVPLLYQALSAELWMVSAATFAGLPTLLGIRWGQPTRSQCIAAGALVLACPAIYALTDLLPTHFEMLRDAFFLATASAVTFVSATWTGSQFRSRQWIGLVGAALLLVCASGVVTVLTAVFVYLV